MVDGAEKQYKENLNRYGQEQKITDSIESLRETAIEGKRKALQKLSRAKMIHLLGRLAVCLDDNPDWEKFERISKSNGAESELRAILDYDRFAPEETKKKKALTDDDLRELLRLRMNKLEEKLPKLQGNARRQMLARYATYMKGPARALDFTKPADVSLANLRTSLENIKRHPDDPYWQAYAAGFLTVMRLAVHNYDAKEFIRAFCEKAKTAEPADLITFAKQRREEKKPFASDGYKIGDPGWLEKDIDALLKGLQSAFPQKIEWIGKNFRKPYREAMNFYRKKGQKTAVKQVKTSIVNQQKKEIKKPEHAPAPAKKSDTPHLNYRYPWYQVSEKFAYATSDLGPSRCNVMLGRLGVCFISYNSNDDGPKLNKEYRNRLTKEYAQITIKTTLLRLAIAGVPPQKIEEAIEKFRKLAQKGTETDLKEVIDYAKQLRENVYPQIFEKDGYSVAYPDWDHLTEDKNNWHKSSSGDPNSYYSKSVYSNLADGDSSKIRQVFSGTNRGEKDCAERFPLMIEIGRECRLIDDMMDGKKRYDFPEFDSGKGLERPASAGESKLGKEEIANQLRKMGLDAGQFMTSGKLDGRLDQILQDLLEWRDRIDVLFWDTQRDRNQEKSKELFEKQLNFNSKRPSSEYGLFDTQWHKYADGNACRCYYLLRKLVKKGKSRFEGPDLSHPKTAHWYQEFLKSLKAFEKKVIALKKQAGYGSNQKGRPNSAVPIISKNEIPKKGIYRGSQKSEGKYMGKGVY